MADRFDDAPKNWAERHPLLSFQLPIWALLTGTATLPALSARVALSTGLGWVSAWALSGLLWSSLLGLIYQRVPEALLRGARIIVVIVPLSLLASACWTGTLALLHPLIGTEPWLPPELPRGREMVMGFARSGLICSLWSGLFLVSLLSTRVQRARERTLHVEATADQAQLQLLRSQINPHFLFNALNSIVALISENPKRAQDMVRDVASLLRAALTTDGQKEASLASEIAFVKLYVKCEQVRFEESLRVTWNVAPDVEPLLVPPMLLHPLVENAIKHGQRVDQPLELHISAERQGPSLLLEVRNTGTLERGPTQMLPASPGVGLQNVRGRLRRLFPEVHAFDLFEAEGQVVARLAIPARTS